MESNPLPQSKQEAFLESPLYAVFSLEDREDDALVKFFYGGGTLDAWCLKCEQQSVFRISGQLPGGYGEEKQKQLPHAGLIEITASCTRGVGDGDRYSSGCQSLLHVIFFKDYKTVRKVGQNPSAADLAFGSLDEALQKELNSADRSELGTAIGLHAHGVGIGSFVYLRRIFEGLLEEAHVEAQAEAAWDEAQYEKAKTSGRIQLLKRHLPPRLVASANLYSFLSLGIHELSEDKCLEAFPLVKAAIELILKERYEEKRFEATVNAVNAKKSVQ